MNSNNIPQLGSTDGSQVRAALAQYVGNILQSNDGNMGFDEATMARINADGTMPFFKEHLPAYVNGNIPVTGYISNVGKIFDMNYMQVRGVLGGREMAPDLDFLMDAYVGQAPVLDITQAPGYKGMSALGKIASVGLAGTLLAAGCGYNNNDESEVVVPKTIVTEVRQTVEPTEVYSGIPVNRSYFSNELHDKHDTLYLVGKADSPDVYFSEDGTVDHLVRIGPASDYMSLDAIIAAVAEYNGEDVEFTNPHTDDTARSGAVNSAYNPVGNLEDIISVVGSFNHVGQFVDKDGKVLSYSAIPLTAGKDYAAADGRPETVYLMKSTLKGDDADALVLYTQKGDPLALGNSYLVLEDPNVVSGIMADYTRLLDANGLKINGESGEIISKDGNLVSSDPWLDMSKPGIDDHNGLWKGITLDKYGNHVNEDGHIAPGGDDVAIPVIGGYIKAGSINEGTQVFLTQRAPGYWDARDQNGTWIGPASKFVNVENIAAIEKHNQENLQASKFDSIKAAWFDDQNGQRRTLANSVIGDERFGDGMSFKDMYRAGIRGNSRGVGTDGTIYDTHSHNYPQRVLRGTLGAVGEKTTDTVGSGLDEVIDGLFRFVTEVPKQALDHTVGRVPGFKQVNEHVMHPAFKGIYWVGDKAGDAVEKTPTVLLNAPADVMGVIDVATVDKLVKPVEGGHPQGTPVVNSTRFAEEDTAKNVGVHAVESVSGLLKILGAKHVISPDKSSAAASSANTGVNLGGSGNLGEGIGN